MPEGLGELFSGAAESFTQGRDYQLALGQYKQAAQLRLKEFALREEESRLQQIQTKQAIEEGRIKTQAEKLDLEDQVRKGKLAREAEGFLERARLTETMRGKLAPSGRPYGVTERLEEVSPGRMAEQYELAGRPVMAETMAKVAGEEAALATPSGRRMQELKEQGEEAKIAASKEQTAYYRRGGRQTQTDFDQYFNEYVTLELKGEPNLTPEEKIRYQATKRKVLGDAKTMTPIEIHDTVISLLAKQYGVKWGIIPEDQKNKLINEAGARYYKDEWIEFDATEGYFD